MKLPETQEDLTRGVYSWVTQEMFDLTLLEVMCDMGMGAVLKVPGVYETVSEKLNSEVLTLLDTKREAEEESA